MFKTNITLLSFGKRWFEYELNASINNCKFWRKTRWVAQIEQMRSWQIHEMNRVYYFCLNETPQPFDNVW